MAQALDLITRGKLGKSAHVLEGPSSPDVLLSTDQLLVVIEGKRTEPEPTTSTSWLRVRHQMVRHLDAAWEIKRGRDLVGLLILSEDRITDQAWVGYQTVLKSLAAIAGSLPHRSASERQDIAGSFLGITSWEAICRRFSIPSQVLIPAIAQRVDKKAP